VTPTIRLLYQITPVDKIIVIPFLGYNKFGGKSDPYSNEYIDIYWFEALELGLTVQYEIQKIRIGTGIKNNFHMDVKMKEFGSPAEPAGSDRSWHTHSVMETYSMPKSSFDLGAKIGIRLRRFICSGEAWFGLSDLVQGSIFGEIATSHENHYRVLIGYVLD
jgi:hypothetical protein